MANINNLPEYAYDYPFIVAVGELEDLWFYGAFRDFNSAQRVADDVDGIVVAR